MEKFTAWVEKNLLPVAGKIGAQRHLSAIRDGFIATIAISMAGSFAVLLNNLPWGISDKLKAAIPAWGAVNGHIWWSTFAVFSLFAVISISFSLAKSYGEQGVEAPLVALACFFIVGPEGTYADGAMTAWGVIPWGYINQTALLTGLLIAIGSTEVFIKLGKSKKLVIQMPEGVPPAVSRSFAKLLPGIITIALFAIVNYFIVKGLSSTGSVFLNDWINATIAKPLQQFTDSLGAAILIPFVNQFLWFFGLHGSNILTPFISPLFGPMLERNMAIFQGLPHPDAALGYAIVAGPFLDAFVYFGGSGATLGLLVAIFLFSKSKQRREVANIGIAPAIFQINEPVIFGMPMVLNPTFMIPFVFIAPILGAVAYLGIKAGISGPMVATMPWTTPAILGGFIATGGQVGGAILAAINFALSIVLWLPFVILADIQDKKTAAQAE